jgi:hypothetical protein
VIPLRLGLSGTGLDTWARPREQKTDMEQASASFRFKEIDFKRVERIFIGIEKSAIFCRRTAKFLENVKKIAGGV